MAGTMPCGCTGMVPQINCANHRTVIIKIRARLYKTDVRHKTTTCSRDENVINSIVNNTSQIHKYIMGNKLNNWYKPTVTKN